MSFPQATTARILCSVSLYCELYAEDDGSDARLAAEQDVLSQALASFKAFAAAFAQGGDGNPLIALDPSGDKLGDANKGDKKQRPYFTLLDLAPREWSIVFNTFRRADELEVSFPLDVFPIPAEAVRNLTCRALVRQVSADDWGSALEGGIRGPGGALRSLPSIGEVDAPDFYGICLEPKYSVTVDAVPMVKLRFLDFLGLLANKKVETGKELSHEMPISQAVAQFLVGTPAEALDVAWVDSKESEPTLLPLIPKAHKKRGKQATASAYGKESYLDVLVQECGRIGVVPRVNVSRLELAYAGTMYAGDDRGGDIKATLLVGNTIEKLEADHKLIGEKTQTIQVHSYDPDTGRGWTARWPPDPKQLGPVQVKPGEPPRLPPVAANIGLPGYEQLDESILFVPIGPVADPSKLPQAAEAIFLERTRQRIRYRLTTHAPWSDPTDPTDGSILKLRAGDNIRFGYLAPTDPDAQGIMPLAVQALSGDIGEQGMARILQASGIAKELAVQMAHVVAAVPRTSRWRVDELHVHGSDRADAEIELRIVNFTVITADLQAKGDGKRPEDVLGDLQAQINDLANAAAMAVEDIQALFTAARQKLDAAATTATQSSIDDMKRQLDALQRAAMKGR